MRLSRAGWWAGCSSCRRSGVNTGVSSSCTSRSTCAPTLRQISGTLSLRPWRHRQLQPCASTLQLPCWHRRRVRPSGTKLTCTCTSAATTHLVHCSVVLPERQRPRLRACTRLPACLSAGTRSCCRVLGDPGRRAGSRVRACTRTSTFMLSSPKLAARSYACSYACSAPPSHQLAPPQARAFWQRSGERRRALRSQDRRLNDTRGAQTAACARGLRHAGICAQRPC